MDVNLAIENAVAVSANALAYALGAVLLPYILIGLIYGRLIRKYRLGVILLGLLLSVASYLVAQFAVDLDMKYMLAAAVVSSVVGLEVADLLLSKLRKKPVAAV